MHKYSRLRIPALNVSVAGVRQTEARPGKVRLLTAFWPKSRHLPLLYSCLLFCALALGFNLYRLGDPSVWFDEAFSVELARQPLPLLWHIIFGPEPNMELYYLLLHYWLLLTHACGLNPTEVVVRLPSALFAALSTVVLFVFGRRFLSLTAAAVGTGLYLLNDLQLTYAQQARGYSLQLLLLCLSWYALFRAFTPQKGIDEGTTGNQQGTRRRYTFGTLFASGRQASMWWLGYVLFTTLAVYTQLFSLLVIVAQVLTVGIWCLWPQRSMERRWHGLLAMLLSQGVVGLLILPLLWISRHGSKTGWLPIPRLHDLYGLFLTICGNNKVYLVLACLLIATSVYCCLHRWHTLDKAWLRAMIALLCWLIVPVVISYVVSQGPTRLFSSRYLVVIVPPFCLLVGMGLALIPWRILRSVLMLGVVLLALRVVPFYYASAQVEDWNTATHWLEQYYRANDGIVCYDNVQGCQIAVQYYLDAYPSAAHFDLDSPGAYSWATYGPVDPVTGYEAAILPSALARYAAHHPRLFFVTGRIPDQSAAARAQKAVLWLNRHYHLLKQCVTRTVVVRLYQTE